MNARRPGFTLVEMLVATVLTTIVLGAIYQTVTVQQRGSRRLGAIVNTQQTVRTSLQVLQSELREIGASAGDIEEAASDHLRIRALRKSGLICPAAVTATTANIYTFGDTLAMNDTLSVYADLGDSNPANDGVVSGVVSAIAAVTAPACPDTTGAPWQAMNTKARKVTLNMLNGATLAGVSAGGSVRSYKRVTYGVYSRGGKYVFGRRDAFSGDTVATLIGPLAAGGLTLSYFDTLDAALTTNPLTAAQLLAVGRIHLSITGSTPGGGDAGHPYSAALVSDIYLRGN